MSILGTDINILHSLLNEWINTQYKNKYRVMSIKWGIANSAT